MYFTFGEWLRDQRKAAGMTQETLGERVGLTRLQVSRLESGLQRASANAVRPLIEALNADPVEAASWLQRVEQMEATRPRTAAPKTPRTICAAPFGASAHKG